MGPDLDAAVRTRCPSCAGAVRPDAPWCTQCYADLRPAAAPEPAPVLERVVERAADPVPQPAGPVDGATWPCTTCGAANGLDRDVCAACGAGFLSALKATEEPLLVLPVVGDLGALSRAQRLGLAAGVVVAVVLLVLLVGLLLG